MTTLVWSQTGFLRGNVLDKDAGYAAIGANVLVVETGSGVITDLDGNYSIKLNAGTYTIKVSYTGYATQEFKDITIKAGETTILDVQLSSEAEVIDQIVVVDKAITNTDQAINTLKAKAAVPLDGLSNQSLRRIGGSKASDVIKAVTGVSVEGGKYVFVRGLGDRYTKTILNGMDIPGLDPDRNTLQMDIFPSSIIENIIVYKAFSPDLPGDFTGGIVNIDTKEFPQERTFNISAGIGYNPDMNGNSNYLTSNTEGEYDWLGFDDGSRDLKFRKDFPIPNPAQNSQSLELITRAFSSELAAKTATSPINSNLSISYGDQHPLGEGDLTLGYNAAVNYRNTTTFFEEVEYNTYQKSDDLSVFELDQERIQKGSLGSNNVLLSGLAGLALKSTNHKVSLNLISIQNGQSSGGLFNSDVFISSAATLITDNIEYTERSINNALLKGKHSFGDGDFEVEWKLSPTISTINDKDIKATSFRLDDGVLSIDPAEGALPVRLWRNLEETNYTGRIDLTKKIPIGSGDNKRDSKLKGGFSYVEKTRDYEILAYEFRVRNQSTININGDPDALLQPENIWTTQTDAGTYAIGNFEPTNTFNATQNILGGYLMHDVFITPELRAIYGLRVEQFEHFYTGTNNLGDVSFDNEKIIESTNFLPSLNLVYELRKKMNLRVSYNRTVARPSFKEASIAQIFDAISGRTFIGNVDLEVSEVDNYDIRWELFQNSGQLFAVSGFYKSFSNPIELVAFSQAAPNSFTPRNVGDAQILGLEVEVKQNLDFISEKLNKFSLGTNVTLVDAQVEMDQSENGEFQSRTENARVGETIEETRPMQGQAPYIINAYVNYVDRAKGWEGNVSYNVQGKSLFIVGIGQNPDVFQSPFNGLNLKVTKTFGTTETDGNIQDGKFRVSLRATNLLNANQQKVYESFGSDDQIFELFRPARTFSLSFGYRFF